MAQRRRPRRVMAEPGTFRPPQITTDPPDVGAPAALPLGPPVAPPPAPIAGAPGAPPPVAPVAPAAPAAPLGAPAAPGAPGAPPGPAGDPPPAPAGPVTAAAPDPAAAANVHLADVLAALGVRSSAIRLGREASPYDPTTEEGRGRSFFADVRAAAQGDQDARARTLQFQAQLGEYISAAMDTADTSDAIPPQWGGRWYVEQIEQMRPMVSSFDSTVITDPRTIPIPRFAGTTPAQIVTEHTEGDPPNLGVVNVEQIEMKPKGYSGETEITRELLDSSPALVDRMVSEALQESYAQQTEAAFVALVNAGATPGPAGGATALTLELAIRTALAAFPTTRFRTGGRVLPSASHYSALSTANAPDGRPLMPYVGYGPTNAAGVSAAAFARMEIAGVETVASWANPGNRTLLRAASSDAMSFESSLLDFRFYEKSGPHLISFAVWGYFGGVVRQPRGVVGITSTAAAELTAEETANGGDSGSHRRKAE